YSKSGGLTYAVYVRKTDGSPAVLLGEGAAVALSPDGKWVVAQSPGSPAQLRLLPTGVGEAKVLTQDSINHAWARWFPDGKRILFSGNEPGRGVRLYTLDIASGKSQPVSPEGVAGTAFAISPDSRFVAAIGPDQKGYWYPLDGGTPKPIPGFLAGEQPIIFNGRGGLYVYQPGELPARVFLLDLQTGHRTLWRHLMRRPACTGITGRSPTYIWWMDLNRGGECENACLTPATAPGVPRVLACWPGTNHGASRVRRLVPASA